MSVKLRDSQVRAYLKKLPRANSAALSKAVTKTAIEARDRAREAMHTDLDRPTPWTVQGIQAQRASRKDPVAKVFVEDRRLAYLKYQIFGGVHRPKGRVVMVGTKNVPRTKHGNVRGYRRIRQRLLSQKNTWEGEINKVAGIYRRLRNGRNILLILYVPRTRYRKRYDFFGHTRKKATAVLKPNTEQEIIEALRDVERQTRKKR